MELQESYAQKIESATTQEAKESLEFELQEQLIENSYLGKTGQFIEPLFAPLGFDWKMSVALVS